ncbi:5-aminolevulinate synthase, erythroid-specific, mitochondrial-like isoform X2 [Corticium candelabrum]|uniref:5-aminolevulinate synthase, erythroid-specific, mitochondrial-like isoform X2 n=1 Tax=Corticium candelabrum TaxID=121492 RepID=UPI002E26E8FF|nr:5-aminolevulinate synthase, erythroid-specific, mitochondrial-like isoform X2 [Corticium candelabrum]
MLHSKLMTKCPFLGRVSRDFLKHCGQSLRIFSSKCPVMSSVLRETTSATPAGVAGGSAGINSHQPKKNCPFHASSFPCRRDCVSPSGNHCTLDFTNPMVEQVSVGAGGAAGADAKLGVKSKASSCPFSHMFETVQDKEKVTVAQMEEKRANSPVDWQKNVGVFDYNGLFAAKLDEKRKDNSYRVFKTVQRLAQNYPKAENYYTSEDGKTREMQEVTIWCANDYLGMSRHPDVLKAARETLEKYGVGAGGTRNISGNGILHEALEASLAELHRKDAALLFTSCFNANDTTLAVLGKYLPNMIYFSDKGNHRSMIDGVRHSGAKKQIFRHNDVQHLEELLQAANPSTPKIVAFETVYSMAGTISPLREMCDVAHKYGALTFVDEVHAVGLYGHRGAGVAEELGLMDHVDIVSGTLGKAFGVHGGYIASSNNLVDMVRSFGAGFIFTTSMPPINAAAALTSIQILKGDEGRTLRAGHRESVKKVKEMLIREGIPIGCAPSHIIPIEVNNAKACQAVCDDLLNEQGIYVQAINYPTVDVGQEKLRVTPSPHHTNQMINQFVGSILTVWKKHNLPLIPEAERDPSAAHHLSHFLETQADNRAWVEPHLNLVRQPMSA